MELILLGIIAAVAGIFAISFWQQTSQLKKRLEHGGQQFDQQRQRIQHLESKAAQTEQLQKSLKEQEKEQKQRVKAFEQKIQTAEKELETKEREFHSRLRNIELQRDHLIKQADQSTDRIMLLQQQLNDALEQKGQVEFEISKLRKEIKADTQKADGDALRAKIYGLEKDLELKNLDLKNAQSKLAEINPEKVAAIKKKATHYEKLFVSMRSLREMSDERSSNWEVALRKLSLWVLKEKGQDPSLNIEQQMILGALVGEALEAIGTSLIDPKDDIAPPNMEVSAVADARI